MSPKWILINIQNQTALEVTWHSTSGAPVEKRSQTSHALHGWDIKDCTWQFLLSPRMQTDFINLCASCISGFTLMFSFFFHVKICCCSVLSNSFWPHRLYQIASICWIIEKAKEFQKNIYFCVIDYAKAFDCVDHNKLWTILKEMGIPDHLTCLLRSLYADQEATVGTRHGKMHWFKTGEGVHQDWVKKIPWSRKWQPAPVFLPGKFHRQRSLVG